MKRLFAAKWIKLRKDAEVWHLCLTVGDTHAQPVKVAAVFRAENRRLCWHVLGVKREQGCDVPNMRLGRKLATFALGWRLSDRVKARGFLDLEWASYERKKGIADGLGLFLQVKEMDTLERPLMATIIKDGNGFEWSVDDDTLGTAKTLLAAKRAVLRYF